MPDIIYLNELTEDKDQVRQRPNDPTIKESLPAPVVIVLEGAMKIAFWLFLLALAYDVYAIAGGAVGAFPSLDRFQQYQLMRNLGVAGKILAAAGGYLALYTLMSAYELRDRFFMMAGVFALFHFGLPFLFLNILGLFNNNPAFEIVTYADITASICLLVVGFRLLLAVINFMQEGLVGAMSSITAQRGKMTDSRSRSDANKKPFYRVLAHCWELPYCREYLLKVCPAWQRKKTCWKHGSGCFCDPGMMDRLIQIEMAPGPGRAKSPTVSIPRGPAKCHTCPIYLAHEESKYRIMSPMIPVAGLVGLVVGWDWIVQHYVLLAQGLSGIVGVIAVGQTRSLSVEWMKTMTDPVVMYTLICCGMLVAVTYGLRFAEWAILQKKL
ncbi:MAG: hypothetical protein M3Y56_00855 [Armatimonadota bacterium]|nr:hypothetical protein [Armatimonadota bacterium]